MAGKKKWIRYAAALALAFTLAVTPAAAPPAQAATSLSDLQKKQKELAAQKAEADAELKSIREDKAQKQAYKDKLDAQMATVQAQIDNYNAQIAACDASISEKTAQIADKQSNIDYNFGQLKERLCALYMAGEASTLEIILNSKSVMDLADKTQMLKAITEHDTQLIQTLKVELTSIADEKKEIEADRASVAEAKKQLDVKRSELSALEAEAQKVLDELAATEQSAQAEKARIDKEEAKAGAEIDKWWKDYYAAQKAAQEQPASYVGGQFTWPVPGFTHISCDYSSGHLAIDINRTNGRSISGQPIVAANSGTVVKAEWHYSYGNYVMIDHGGGYSTLYAHASSLAVKAGQTVSKGQVVAYVGSTGNSTGPHLHFEIRVNGARKNPWNWFKKA